MSDYIFIHGNEYDLENINNSGKDKIIFGEQFNSTIDNLPNSIKKIQLPHCYTHPLYNLPNQLIYLKLLAYKYPHALNNLPNTLEILIIGNDIMNPLDNLPNSLKILHVLGIYQYPLDNLPSQLEELMITELDPKIHMDNLPNSIKNLSLSNLCESKIENWPSSLKILDIIKYAHPIDNIILESCPNLIELNVSGEYKYSIDNISNSVEFISFHRDYNIDIHKLPKNLKKIRLENIKKKSLIKCDIEPNIEITDKNLKDNINFFIS